MNCPVKIFGYTVVLVLIISQGCVKTSNTSDNLHSATVLAATCPFQSTSTEVAVQFDNNDPLSFDWTDPMTNSVYHHVVVTFDSRLSHAIGRSLSYSSVRKPANSDTLANLTLGICLSYPVVYLDDIIIK